MSRTDKLFAIEAELLSPRIAASSLGLTTRQLLNLEEKGLPVKGQRADKRYPWPDIMRWYVVFRVLYQRDRGSGVGYLDPKDAVVMFDRQAAIKRAWHRLEHPELYRNAEPLDSEALRYRQAALSLQALDRSPYEEWPALF